MEFTITSTQILWLCGFIGSIWAVYKIVKELNQPKKELEEKVKKHDELLDRDNNRLKEVEESNKIICKSMLVLINHEITGNGIEKMKQARDELQEFLIEK